MTEPNTVYKQLTKNDLGLTGSHQAGFVVPKPCLGHFPHLDPSQLNPSVFLEVIDHDGDTYAWRYIYYNNRLHGSGTRNEYRITHTTKFMRNVHASPNDQLELRRVSTYRYHVRIVPRPPAEVLILDTRGKWSSSRLRQ